ncbi:MAG: glycerophosphodiester phosphodiesterase [Myxococcales bacterium]|nr:glycerophosphodiester phosphodiesterase [Myxococcales bacterium]
MKLPARPFRPLRPLTALGLALGSTALPSGEARADCSCREAAVVVMGHRGTGTNGPANPWPENTLPSFEQGVAEGADWIELDVQHSADGALVVLHDETVDRTTDGTGCAGALGQAALAALDAAAGTPLAGTGVTIPTLDEVLAAVDVGVNIEIKIESGGSCPASDRTLLAADVVAAIHADAKSRPLLVSSFDADVLTLVKALDASVPVGLLGVDPADLTVATSRGFDALHPFYLAVDATPTCTRRGSRSTRGRSTIRPRSARCSAWRTASSRTSPVSSRSCGPRRARRSVPRRPRRRAAARSAAAARAGGSRQGSPCSGSPSSPRAARGREAGAARERAGRSRARSPVSRRS